MNRPFFPKQRACSQATLLEKKISKILDNTNGKNIVVILIKAAFKKKKKHAETIAFINLTKKEDYHFLW